MNTSPPPSHKTRSSDTLETSTSSESLKTSASSDSRNLSAQTAYPFELSTTLAKRLFPLVVLVGTLVSISTPLTFFWRQMRALEQDGKQDAHRIASFLRQEASQQPALWRYNLPKVLHHIRLATPNKHLLSVLVLDPKQRSLLHHKAPILRQDPQILSRAIWASAPLFNHARQPLGTLWIALSTEAIRQQTSILWLLFSLLGLALAILLYRWPLHTTQHAEDALQQSFSAIQQTQAELAQTNLHLENLVQERTQELAQAYQQLQDKERTHRKLSKHLLALQETERRAISRDLHDQAGQSLTAIRIHLQLLSNLPTPPPDLIAQTTQLVDQTIEEIRRAVRQLSPTILEDRGLLAALRTLCIDLSERLGITPHIDLPPMLPPFTPALELACYRIAQEALTNIARHAHATRFYLSLHLHTPPDLPAFLQLQIADDGCGLPNKSHPHGDQQNLQGSGLQGIRERVEILDGHFTLSSTNAPHPSPQTPHPFSHPFAQGTHLSIVLPVCFPDNAPTQSSTFRVHSSGVAR